MLNLLFKENKLSKLLRSQFFWSGFIENLFLSDLHVDV